MAPELDFCLLGPLMVRSDGVPVAVPPGKQRAVLAALLLNAGRVVPVAELAEALWGAAPPPSAPVTIRNYVKRLRHTLGEAGPARIRTQPPGYLISVSAGELDVSRFERLLAAARTAGRNGAWDIAAGQARAALSLWRGDPLTDVESEVVAARQVPRLAEMRLQATETRIEAELHLGQHRDVIAELRRLTAVHPLREHLHSLLMLALYQDGRQAEALATYRHARQVLVDQIGAEPGAELRELHSRIRNAGAVVAAARPGPATADDRGPVVPRELPGPVRHFVGRAQQLAELTRLLDRARAETPGTVVISAIGGTAGVGKTALALHWSHQVASRFPDGQLYVNLRGYDPDRPVLPEEALAGLLHDLGVAGHDIPAAAAERAARYRSLLAGRQMLVLLDNAGSAEQVRPLLPGTPSCMALVTSRDALAGLVAREGAQRVDLDLLPPPEAVSLLRELIGARVDADPTAAAALAAGCARLPLALRVAAELAAARPAVSLAELAGELDGQQQRLDLLDAGGDRRTAVRAVFSWSCRHLDTDAARTFRLLGLHPGPDIGRFAAAALTGTTAERARQLLDKLSRACLTHATGPDRYGMHDLLRAYARELAIAHDGEQARHAALTRLFDHYLHTASAAMDTLFPAESGRRPRIPVPVTPVPPVTGAAAARAWLDAERANLVAVATHTAAHGWPGHTTRLAGVLFRYLDAGGHLPEAVSIHGSAHHAAAQAGDRAAGAEALTSLGVVCLRQSRYQEATSHLRQALALYRQTGDRAGEARALHNLGGVELFQGRFEHASACFQQALALRREIGDRAGEARALGNLGALGLIRRSYPEAASHIEAGLALCREIGDRAGEARALANLGTLDLRQGRYEPAAGHFTQALALCRECGDRSSEVEALNGLGEVLLATGQPGQAVSQHTAALDLASKTGDKYEQARAHDGLARICSAGGDPGKARHHWQQALTLYTGLGAPEAAQVRARLATTDGHGDQQQ
jgi:DNA-binding SARP family transcriptional activator/uncharacterized protein HemY